ncbi:MAG: hypothetical protein LBR81_00660 [Prevotellaceae bacterium]|nr:hypothetical protein [Prevotellaceae bacterium]
MAVVSLGFISCSDDDDKDGGGSTVLDGTWGASSPVRALSFSGRYWVYTEKGQEYSKGTWSSSSELTIPSSGEIKITVTHFKQGGTWVDFPANMASVKTNTVDYDLTATTLIVSNAELTTNGVWGTTEGVYTKQ